MSTKLIRLWSIQPTDRVVQLKRTGRIIGRRLDCQSACSAIVEAYDWMSKQMANRIGEAPPAAPCWAWYQWKRKPGHAKPDLRFQGHLEAGTSGACIEMDIPAKLVLLSQFELWESVLVGAPIVLDNDEQTRFLDMESAGQLDDEIVRKTWGRVFDLTAGHVDIWDALEDRAIQACIPFIDMEHVRSIEELV